MDKKRTIIAMAIMMAVVFLWTPTINWVGTRLGYDMRPPVAQHTTPTTEPTTNPSTTQPLAMGETPTTATPSTATSSPAISASSRLEEQGSRSARIAATSTDMG